MLEKVILNTRRLHCIVSVHFLGKKGLRISNQFLVLEPNQENGCMMWVSIFSEVETEWILRYKITQWILSGKGQNAVYASINKKTSPKARFIVESEGLC